jgi:ribosomal protein L29
MLPSAVFLCLAAVGPVAGLGTPAVRPKVPPTIANPTPLVPATLRRPSSRDVQAMGRTIPTPGPPPATSSAWDGLRLPYPSAVGLALALVGTAAALRRRTDAGRRTVAVQAFGDLPACDWVVASTTGASAEVEVLPADFNPRPSASDYGIPPLAAAAFRPRVTPSGLRPRGRKDKWDEKPNPEYDEPIYQLKKKLLQLRMMQTMNHPDFRSSDMRRAKKMVARLLTAKRFEQLREEGIDPYAKYKKPKKQRQIERAERLTREAFEAKEAVASVHRQRQRQLKVERRAERQAQRGAAAAAGSNNGPTDNDSAALGSTDTVAND